MGVMWYGTGISTTMTVCPTSGSQIEGYGVFEYGKFGMEDGGLDREVGYQTSRGIRSALLARGVWFAEKCTAWMEGSTS